MKQFLMASVSLAFFCSTIIADTYCDTAYGPWQVYSESPVYVVDAEFRALFLKPTANNLYFAVEAFPFNPNIATPIASPRWAIFDFHPDYHFGFDIGLTGVIPSRCSTLDLNWEHFSSSTCASHAVTDTSNMVGPFSSIGPDDG